MTGANRHKLDLFFSGTVNDKMLAMDDLYRWYGRLLLKDNAIIDSLALLKQHATRLSAQMNTMNMGILCSNCANRPGGGCCSSYMEGNSDAILLLINRLHGIDVIRQHENSTECCFLGKSGCILPIKPIFCLNYNCKHILDQSTKTEMNSLEQLAGRLLTEQTNLETLILQRL